jgi:hypothetical protein
MKDLIRIQGRADRVFRTIKSICARHPGMTLKELAERGIRT